jgi:hypothetical protein
MYLYLALYMTKKNSFGSWREPYLWRSSMIKVSNLRRTVLVFLSFPVLKQEFAPSAARKHFLTMIENNDMARLVLLLRELRVRRL